MTKTHQPIVFAALLLSGISLHATDVPLDLLAPDNEPGDASVRVYILAGQSNMVGMGDITGARPLYPSVFLSADPGLRRSIVRRRIDVKLCLGDGILIGDPILDLDLERVSPRIQRFQRDLAQGHHPHTG